MTLLEDGYRQNIDALRAERDRLKEQLYLHAEDRAKLEVQVSRLKAEVERLCREKLDEKLKRTELELQLKEYRDALTEMVNRHGCTEDQPAYKLMVRRPQDREEK